MKESALTAFSVFHCSWKIALFNLLDSGLTWVAMSESIKRFLPFSSNVFPGLISRLARHLARMMSKLQLVQVLNAVNYTMKT